MSASLARSIRGFRTMPHLTEDALVDADILELSRYKSVLPLSWAHAIVVACFAQTRRTAPFDALVVIAA